MDIHEMGLIPNWVRNIVSASASDSQMQKQSYSVWTELLADGDTKLLAQCEQSYSQMQMQMQLLTQCEQSYSQTQMHSYSLNVNGVTCRRRCKVTHSMWMDRKVWGICRLVCVGKTFIVKSLKENIFSIQKVTHFNKMVFFFQLIEWLDSPYCTISCAFSMACPKEHSYHWYSCFGNKLERPFWLILPRAFVAKLYHFSGCKTFLFQMGKGCAFKLSNSKFVL